MPLLARVSQAPRSSADALPASYTVDPMPARASASAVARPASPPPTMIPSGIVPPPK